MYAFGYNESRMSQEDESLKWNKFKWALFATNSLVRFLRIFVFYPFSSHTAHDLFFCRSRRLSANMVQCLGKVICHMYRELTRTNPLDNDSRHWSLNVSNRLGWYSPQ